MLYYAYRVCARRTYKREKAKLFAARPADACAALTAAIAGDDVARLAYADLAEEEGLSALSYFIRECMTCSRPKWLGKEPKKRKAAKKKSKKRSRR